MIAGLSTLDLLALVWFGALWFGYALLVDRSWAQVNINRAMRDRRQEWMRQMIRRDNRMPDVVLTGQIMHSVSFFASTTLIVVAALLGALGAIDQIRAALGELHFAIEAPRSVWQLKFLLLVVLFVYSFFKFTWSLRQWNYFCVMIGSVPAVPVDERTAEDLSRRLGRLASAAAINFNGGLRAYYFALSMLAWFIHPLAFMIAALWVLAVLAWRQFKSDAATAIVS